MDNSFLDNITIKQVDNYTYAGLYIETYGTIPGGSCRYGQFYRNPITPAEARQKFIAFYKPHWEQDNARKFCDNCQTSYCEHATEGVTAQ